MSMFCDKQESSEDTAVAFRAAGCFCVVGEEILLMQRNPRKPYGLHWAIPTGKIEAGETARDCIVRELKEELKIEAEPSALELVGDFIVQADTTTFEYVTFVLYLDRMP